MSTIKTKKGFTLIEIVIVLAIAALILVGVLLAVGGAQRTRRDTQRKNDMGRIASYLENYASNHNGAYPTNDNNANTGWTGGFNTNFITGNNLNDPLSGAAYTLTSGTSATNPACAAPTSAASSHVYYWLAGRVYTIRICLEQGVEATQTNQ